MWGKSAQLRNVSTAVGLLQALGTVRNMSGLVDSVCEMFSLQQTQAVSHFRDRIGISALLHRRTVHLKRA